MSELTYREAVRAALAEELERDKNVVLMGEEVAQFNGAYKVSEGLLDRFGPDRVVDTPISVPPCSGSVPSWNSCSGRSTPSPLTKS